MKHCKQLTSEKRYQIAGLKKVGLRQSHNCRLSWRVQVNDITEIKLEQRVAWPATKIGHIAHWITDHLHPRLGAPIVVQ